MSPFSGVSYLQLIDNFYKSLAMESLAQLLHPYSVEDFLAHYWGKKAIAIAAKEQRQFDSLFSWQTLNHLLNFHEFHYPDLRLALAGQVLDERENEKLLHWLQQGATLIIDRVHQWVPAIATFTTAVRYELGYATQVNAYCSFPGQQGFACHYDTHDVFILQIDGSKEWRVLTDTFKYPLAQQKSSTLSPPDTPPYLTCVLHPGDVLYIPRGHWHDAIALNEPSLHLTLGIHIKTGIDWLEWLIEQCCQQEEWRQSLPLRVSPNAIQDSVHHFSQRLRQMVEATDLAREYECYLDSLGQPIAKYSLPQQPGFKIFPQGQHTTFAPQPFQRRYISPLPDGVGYKITTMGKEVSLAGVPLSVIEMMFNQTQFTGQDVLSWLPEYDWDLEIAPLLSRLVMEGILALLI